MNYMEVQKHLFGINGLRRQERRRYIIRAVLCRGKVCWMNRATEADS